MGDRTGIGYESQSNTEKMLSTFSAIVPESGMTPADLVKQEYLSTFDWADRIEEEIRHTVTVDFATKTYTKA